MWQWIYQKFSPAEKDRELEMLDFKEECRKKKKGIVLGILGRGAERVQKVAAWYWCCCDFKRRSDVLQWGTCWETEGEASKNAPHPNLLVVLSSHISFYFSVLASWIHIPSNCRCCHWFLWSHSCLCQNWQRRKSTDHEDRQHKSVKNCWRYSLGLALLPLLLLRCESIDSGIALEASGS